MGNFACLNKQLKSDSDSLVCLFIFPGDNKWSNEDVMILESSYMPLTGTSFKHITITVLIVCVAYNVCITLIALNLNDK